MDEWTKYAGMNALLAAPVDFIMPDYPRKKIRGMGRIAQMTLVTADRALQNAGLAESPELTEGRYGIAYGSSMGSVEPLVDFYSMLVLNEVKNINATTYIRSMPQTCAANLSVFYGLTGRLITTNVACASGSMAIGYAYEAVRTGLQDIMLTGGAEELLPADVAIFDTLFAASTKNDTPESTPRAYVKHDE